MKIKKSLTKNALKEKYENRRNSRKEILEQQAGLKK